MKMDFMSHFYISLIKDFLWANTERELATLL